MSICYEEIIKIKVKATNNKLKIFMIKIWFLRNNGNPDKSFYINFSK